MKHKKRLWLPVVFLLVLAMSVFTACQWGITQEPEPSESQTQPQPTQPEPTEPTLEETKPEESQMEGTEPEETEPEETEPEETTDTGSGGPNVNTGTGGGYDPGENQPESTEPGTTEPEEDVTEPELEIPPAGSETNAYYENIQNGAGEFTTVKIPAGATVHYRLQTSGIYLQIVDEDICVAYNEATFQPEEGVVELELPGDDTAPFAIAFTNNGPEDRNFTVEIKGDVGSQSNPIAVQSLESLTVSLEQDDADGMCFLWQAEASGMLKLWMEENNGVDINLFVNDAAVQLTQDNGGKLCAQIKAGDEVLVQMVGRSDADGKISPQNVTLRSYVAQMVQYSVMLVPFESESITVEPGQSAYFTVSGVKEKYLYFETEAACLYYGAETIQPDAIGLLGVTATEDTVQMEICNTTSDAATYVLQVHYPLGSILNPQRLHQLGEELEVNTSAQNGGYYLTFQVPSSGLVSWGVCTPPEDAGTSVRITMSNQNTGETVVLTYPQDENSTMQVNAGDELMIYLEAEDVDGAAQDARFTILGNHFGTQENPIPVSVPGFDAQIPAGQTIYYQGNNLNGILFALTAEDVIVRHNETDYTGGQIDFAVVSQGREPAVFAITNTSQQKQTYHVTLSFPLGWRENPDLLILGDNTLTQKAGAGDHYYTFTAPKDGKLVVDFSANAQWTYTLNNLTQDIYGDIQWSDSEPVVALAELEVKENDEIQLIVNTYDPDNAMQTPAGTLTFTAKLQTGPVEIANPNAMYMENLIPGEICEFTGQFQGLILKVTGSADAAVEFNGQIYGADETGTIQVEMPKSGTEVLRFFLYNGGADQKNFSIAFNAENAGTADNPEVLTVGQHSMTQSVVGGEAYYYKIVAASDGTMMFEFEKDVDCVYIIKGTIVRYTHKNQVRYALRVKANEEITLVVNTYDQSNPDVAPLGTVDFKVTM